jgi:hypothetical protein
MNQIGWNASCLKRLRTILCQKSTIELRCMLMNLPEIICATLKRLKELGNVSNLPLLAHRPATRIKVAALDIGKKLLCNCSIVLPRPAEDDLEI